MHDREHGRDDEDGEEHRKVFDHCCASIGSTSTHSKS
jgi:hypothetical protein